MSDRAQPEVVSEKHVSVSRTPPGQRTLAAAAPTLSPVVAENGRSRLLDSTPGGLLALQRMVGNRAVTQLVSQKPANAVAKSGLVIRRAHDSEETDDSDHGEDSFDLDRGTSYIDWSELTQQALRRRSDDTLFAVFYNLAQYHYAKAGVHSRPPLSDLALRDRYLQWKWGGVLHTRSAFKALIGLGNQVAPTDNVAEIIQRARTGNSYSVNGDYTGTSNDFDYENVIYYRDGRGNIEFDDDPANTVDDYNLTEDPEIDEGDIDWEHPMDDSSLIDLDNDLTTSGNGLMPSGKSVKIRTATRSQHFAIADDIYANDRGGTWTWHHLTPRYQMVLVDMRVHAKHGHNGGVYIW